MILKVARALHDIKSQNSNMIFLSDYTTALLYSSNYRLSCIASHPTGQNGEYTSQSYVTLPLQETSVFMIQRISKASKDTEKLTGTRG